MSESKQLIEKFGLAIHGETPRTVLSVLVAFTLVVLERWEIPLEEYVGALRGGAMPRARRASQGVPGVGPG